MSRGEHRPGRRARQQREGIWTILTGGQTGPPDADGRRIVIPPRATNIRGERRARRFAGSVQGSRVVPPRKGGGFWTAKRIGWALLLFALLVLYARSR